MGYYEVKLENRCVLVLLIVKPRKRLSACFLLHVGDLQ